MRARGLEPRTCRLKAGCSDLLSYARVNLEWGALPGSNRRPSGSHPDALPLRQRHHEAGSSTWIRTRDPRVNSPLRCQLRYRGIDGRLRGLLARTWMFLRMSRSFRGCNQWTRLPDSNRGVLAQADLQSAAFDRSAKPCCVWHPRKGSNLQPAILETAALPELSY